MRHKPFRSLGRCRGNGDRVTRLCPDSKASLLVPQGWCHYLLWVSKQQDLCDGTGVDNGVECWQLRARGRL